MKATGKRGKSYNTVSLNSKSSRIETINSKSEKTFTIENKRAWLFLFSIGLHGNDGPYDIFLSTPAHDSTPCVRKATANGQIELTVASNDKGVLTIASSVEYIRGIVVYAV